MKVEVRDGNVEKAIKVLKKKVIKDGLLQEVRKREHYVSRGEKVRKAKEAATRRIKKRRQKDLEKFNKLY